MQDLIFRDSLKSSQKWTIRTETFDKAGGYNQQIDSGASLCPDNKQEINKTMLVRTSYRVLRNQYNQRYE